MAKTKPKGKKERFSKIYREFTRVKFNKYKLQYPRIRESQIVAKIIKEWEAMDEEAKEELAQKYIQKSGKGFLEDPSSSDKKDSKEKKNKSGEPMSISARESRELKSSLTEPPKKKKKISPTVRVFQDKDVEKREGDDYKRKESENSKSPGKKSTPDKKQSSSSELALKKKKIAKGAPLPKDRNKNQGYISFYKYYHDRLSKEHPRWTPAQITTIVRLLWRKRNLKGERREKGIPSKGLTGRQLYNRTKQSEGFLKEQIKQLWRALPHESKKYWQIKGQGKPHRSKKDSGRFVRKVLNSGANKQETATTTEARGNFNWLNAPIQ